MQRTTTTLYPFPQMRHEACPNSPNKGGGTQISRCSASCRIAGVSSSETVVSCCSSGTSRNGTWGFVQGPALWGNKSYLFSCSYIQYMLEVLKILKFKNKYGRISLRDWKLSKSNSGRRKGPQANFNRLPFHSKLLKQSKKATWQFAKLQLQWSSQWRGIIFECGWTILRLTRNFFQNLHNAFTFQVFQGGRWLGCLPTVARKAPPLPQHLDDSGSNSSSDSKLSVVWKLPYCTSTWCTRNDLLMYCILLFFSLCMNHTTLYGKKTHKWQPACLHSSRRPQYDLVVSTHLKHCQIKSCPRHFMNI